MRFVAQSFAAMRYARMGGPVKTEDDPLDPAPPEVMRDVARGDSSSREGGHGRRRHRASIRLFYGADNDGLGTPVRRAAVPDRRRRRRRHVVRPSRRRGGGDRARARARRPGDYNIVDDEPAPVREWLPALAKALDAQPPRRVPAWLARLFAGEIGVMLGRESRGASNAKARRELGWTLRYPSWRQGFDAVNGRRLMRRDVPTAKAA